MKRNILSVLLIVLSVSASFAQGYYLEYKMVMEGIGASGSTKTYFQDGNTRTEAVITRGSYNKTVVTLLLKGTPGKVYLLHEEQKTYDEADVNKQEAMDNGQPADYQVTVLGKEKVNGYNSTHVRILNLKDSVQLEFWTTTEMEGYADYMKIKTKYSGKESLNKALVAKGVAGFPVRIKSVDPRATVQLDLVKAVRQNNPAALFSLGGFAKSADASSSPTSSPASQQELMQKLQNMTPDERQKYIQQMMQQQQQNQPH